MIYEKQQVAKAFYIKRMEQNKHGDEDLNQYIDSRFGLDSRDCDTGSKRRRIDVFRSDDNIELLFYLVTLEEAGNTDDINEDSAFGTFYLDDIHNSPETESGGACGDGEYICSISNISSDELLEISPRLYKIITECFSDLMAVGL